MCKPEQGYYQSTEPAAPEPLGDSEGTATQVVAGFEPVAWMIECSIGFTGWWDGREPMDCRFFNTDPNKGVRFQSIEEAQKLIITKGNSCMRATEHLWFDNSAATVKKLIAEQQRLESVCKDYRDVQERMYGQLAASQAYSQQLWEALHDLWTVGEDCGGITMALSLPQDDTALRQWGAKLLREMADEILRMVDYDPAAGFLQGKADELAGK